jgi:hypothetical protein
MKDKKKHNHAIGCLKIHYCFAAFFIVNLIQMNVYLICQPFFLLCVDIFYQHMKGTHYSSARSYGQDQQRE